MKFELDEPTVKLSLGIDSVGNTLILAHGDRNEKPSALIYFNNDGTIFLCEGIDPTLGFKLDDKGRIKRSNIDL